MAFSGYRIYCYRPGCSELARFKIAARWSDGLTQELKTYALSCLNCLPGQYADSKAKQARCRLAPGETLDVPGIYELARGRRDRELVRRFDLEEELSSSS